MADSAFMLSSLASLTLPSNLIQIKNQALAYMSNLETITIPASVTTIGVSVCREDSSLLSVVVLATTPPSLPSPHYFLLSSNKAKIYVPAGSVDTYKSAAGWSDYASRIFAIE